MTTGALACPLFVKEKMGQFIISNELLNEFRQAVSSYLSDIDKIEYENKIESHIVKKDRSCSILNIYISTKSNYQKLKIDPTHNNWHDDFLFTKEIKSTWNSLLRKYKTLDENDTKIGYVFFRCSESIAKYDIAYHSKNEIQAALEKNRLPKIMYLFCSTQPEYTIILKNERDYKCYETFSLTKINDLILSVLNKNIKNKGYKYIFSTDDFRCQLLHLKMMKGFSLYGLSRED